MPSTGRMFEPEEQSAIVGALFNAIHAMSPNVGEAARASQPAAPPACQAIGLPLFAAEGVVIFRLPIAAIPDRRRIERECNAQQKRRESDKCGGISTGSLITAAARDARGGRSAGAVKRVMLCDNPSALALCGIAREQLSCLPTKKKRGCAVLRPGMGRKSCHRQRWMSDSEITRLALRRPAWVVFAGPFFGSDRVEAGVGLRRPA
jgi:hypothetical protein